MNVRFAFAGHAVTATLCDNPTAADFASMLPLDLTIDDHADNEKLAYLPRKLTLDGAGSIAGPGPGDIGYFSPWGNLAFYHGGYGNDPGLVRIGRLDGGTEPLLTRGRFPLRAERVS